MTGRQFAHLDQRAVLRIGGEDRVAYLQGLVSNDVAKLAADRAIWSAFLTPQGKFLFDIFIAASGEAFYLEVEAERRADLIKRLSMYRLRSKVTIEAADELSVFAAWGPEAAARVHLKPEAGAAGAFGGGLAFVDPRLAEGGLRFLLPPNTAADEIGEAGFEAADRTGWDRHRIGLGLPDGSRDLVPDKTLLLEAGFDELNGVDFQKGCYMGQELTARTKYRGLVKKRLMPVTIEGAAPPPGTPLMAGEAEAGEMRSSCGDMGLAVVRLEAFRAGTPLTAEGATLTPRRPAWAQFPEASAE